MQANIEDRAATIAALHRSINKVSSQRDKLIDQDGDKNAVSILDDKINELYEELEVEVTQEIKPKRIYKEVDEPEDIGKLFVAEALDGIKRIMAAENISQKRLADLLGVTQPTISTAINMNNPSSRWRGLRLTTIARIYDALGYKVHFEITRKDHDDKVKWRNV